MLKKLKIKKNVISKKYSIVAISCLIILAIGITFAWFSSNIQIMNGRLTFGHLSIKTTVYQSDGKTKIYSTDGTSKEELLPDVISTEGFSHLGYSSRYIKIENSGNVDARIFMNMLSSKITKELSEYDQGYFHVAISDITSKVNQLEDYASPTKDKIRVDETEAKAIIDGGSSLNELVGTTKLISNEKEGIIKKDETRYYKVEFLCYEIPDNKLIKVNNAIPEFKVDANIVAKQSNAPFSDGEESGETKSVSDEKTFLEAVRTAGSGDTILITSDIDVTQNITFYHRVNLSLNGHKLKINGNLVYDFEDNGKCKLLVDSSTSSLDISGDFTIDTPNASFTVKGVGTSGIKVGNKFEVNCIRDETDVLGGYYQDNAWIMGNDLKAKNMVVQGHTAIRIGQNSIIGTITASSNAQDISIKNKGSIKQIDLHNMKYWTKDRPEQIYVENGNTFEQTKPAVILPIWSRGNVTSSDVNTTVVQAPGAATVNWSVAVEDNTGSYSATSRQDYISKNPNNTTKANNIYFWDCDIDNGSNQNIKVTRLRATEYLVKMTDQSDSLSNLMNDYYASSEGNSYQSEGVNSLIVYTYGEAKVKTDDFVYMKNNCSLQTLDLSGATMQNKQIPDAALQDKSSLQHLILPNSDVNIGNNAFNGCDIAEVELSNAVKSIGSNAFERMEGRHVFVTWNVGIIPPSEVLSGLDTSYVRLFMDEQLALNMKTERPDWEKYCYERYDFIDGNTFIKIIGTNNARIVYYEGEYGNDMIKNSYSKGREYLTYSIGVNAFRVIADNTSVSVDLTFPTTCKEIRSYAFYKFVKKNDTNNGFRINTLSLYNVDDIGNYAFAYAKITKSLERPNSFEGMIHLGDYAFYNSTLSPVETVASLSDEALNQYAIENNGNPYIAGTLDLSANPNKKLSVYSAISYMNAGAVKIKLDNYDLVGKVYDESNTGGLAGMYSYGVETQFYGVDLSLKDCNAVGLGVFNNHNGVACFRACKNYNNINLQNVHKMGSDAFYNCQLNEVKAGVVNDQYKSQSEVDADFTWARFSNEKSSTFNATSINKIDITGYLPSTSSSTGSILSSSTCSNLVIHDIESTNIPISLFSGCKFDMVEINSNHDLLFKDNCFANAQINKLSINTNGKIDVNYHSFYNVKSKEGGFVDATIEADGNINCEYATFAGTKLKLKMTSNENIKCGNLAFSQSIINPTFIASGNIECDTRAFQSSIIEPVFKAKGLFKIGNYAFYNSTVKNFARYSWVDGNWCHDNVIDVIDNYAFENVLKTSDCLANNKKLDLSKIQSIGAKAFYGCKAALADHLELPDSLTSCGSNAFDSTDIVTLKANGLTSFDKSIVGNCNALVSIELKSINSIPNKKFNMNDADYPKSLQKIVIGSCSYINSNAFGDGSLSKPQFNSMIFEYNNLAARNALKNISNIALASYRNDEDLNNSYIYAYDSNYDKKQFMYQGVQFPQYILRPNNDGTYTITSLRNYYWEKEDKENGSVIKKSDQITEYVKTIPYSDLRVPTSLQDGEKTYNITGIDYGAFYGCNIQGSITFPKEIKQFGMDDTKEFCKTSIVGKYSDNLTGLVFEAGGTFNQPIKGDNNYISINDQAFYNQSFANVNNLQLNHAKIGDLGFSYNTFSKLEEIKMKDLELAKANGLSNSFLNASSYEMENVNVITAAEVFIEMNLGDYNSENPDHMVNWKWKNMQIPDNCHFVGGKSNLTRVREATFDNITFGKIFNGDDLKPFTNLKKLIVNNCSSSKFNKLKFKGMEHLTNLAIEDSTYVVIDGDINNVTNATFNNSTFSINGNMNSLLDLNINNCTVESFSKELSSLKNINLIKTNISSNQFKSKSLPELTSVCIDDCTFNIDENQFKSSFKGMVANKCTSFTVKNSSGLRCDTFDNMLLNESANITFIGNTFEEKQGSNEKNDCKINIPQGTLDLSQQYSLIENSFYGTIGTVKYPDGGLEAISGAKVNPTYNVLNVKNDNNDKTIFKKGTTVNDLYIYASDLTCTPHISGMNINNLHFDKAITNIPHSYMNGGKIDNISFNSDQGNITFTVRTDTDDPKGNAYCWKTDFSDMSKDCFEKLYEWMDTEHYLVFSGCTFPNAIDTIDSSENGRYRIYMDSQFKGCVMNNVKTIIWPSEISNDSVFYNAKLPSLTEIDLTSTKITGKSVFSCDVKKYNDFSSLKLLKLGTVEGNDVFRNNSFPKLETLNLDNAFIEGNMTFYECDFDSMENFTWNNNFKEYSSLKSTLLFAFSSFQNLTYLKLNSDIQYSMFKYSKFPKLTSIDLKKIKVDEYGLCGANFSGINIIQTDNSTYLSNGAFSDADLTSLTTMSWDGLKKVRKNVFDKVKLSDNSNWTFPDLENVYEGQVFSNIKTGHLKLKFPALKTTKPTDNYFKVENSMFESSTAITEIEFGDQMTEICGSGDFKGVENCIVKFKYNGVISVTGDLVKDDVKNVKFFVLHNQLSNYKQNDKWSVIENFIFAERMGSDNWEYVFVGNKSDGKIQLINFSGTLSNSLVVPSSIVVDGNALNVIDLNPEFLTKKDNVTTITIPTSITRLDLSMFDNTNIQSISFDNNGPLSIDHNVTYRTNNSFDANGKSTGTMILSGDGRTLLKVMPKASLNEVILDNTVHSIADDAFKGTNVTSLTMKGIQAISGNAFNGSNITTLNMSMDNPPMLLGNTLYSFFNNTGTLLDDGTYTSVINNGKLIKVAGKDKDGNLNSNYLLAYQKAPGFVAYASIINKDDNLSATKPSYKLPDEFTYNGWQFSIEEGKAILTDYTGNITNGSLVIPTAIVQGEHHYPVKDVRFGSIVSNQLSSVTSFTLGNEISEGQLLLVDHGVLFAKDGTNLTLLRYPAALTLEGNKYTVGVNDYSVVAIADEAFKGASSLLEIRIPAVALKNMGASVFANTNEDLVVLSSKDVSTLQVITTQEIDVYSLNKMQGNYEEDESSNDDVVGE